MRSSHQFCQSESILPAWAVSSFIIQHTLRPYVQLIKSQRSDLLNRNVLITETPLYKLRLYILLPALYLFSLFSPPFHILSIVFL